MWETFEARVQENERDEPLELRRQLFDVLRGSGLRPGPGITKKMACFEFGMGERLVWEIQNPANVFLHSKWRERIESNGFATELRSHIGGLKDGGRHSALSRDWAFGDQDCLVVRVENAESLRRFIASLLQVGDEIVLNPESITRWIERLRHFFPNLHRFDAPDKEFDERERAYKLAIGTDLKAAISQAASDQDLADAVNAALVKSNLLQWRIYWPMSSKGEANREQLWPALRLLVEAASGPPDRHASALEAFVSSWLAAVPGGKPDSARQIAEFLFLHLAPEVGIYIRHSVREELWLEAVGSKFPEHASFADTYRHELRFMRAVRRAFEDRGLAPRDMIDVQSTLWIVHNYRDAEEPRKEESGSFSREAIEEAMDAYDSYRRSGEHSAIFDAFGAPREYWVRSTRARPDRVYPSKPIVGFLLGATQINGGLGQKSDAAAQLHNAGYIIVNSDDVPASLSDTGDHLIGTADRIRLCARNYYVEPARESGMTQVAIRASNLSRAMGLRDSFPVICSALGGEKFQKLANVPPPDITVPNPSSTTLFTYRLDSSQGKETMASEPATSNPATTNLILYGPPGTGKTYATAWEAVRLCVGEAYAQPLRHDRTGLMAEYRRLASEGRIELVTFHQSFSYEDFVEGLRPTTAGDGDDNADGTGTNAGGFSLKAHDGVFKVISERARLDTGEKSAKRLDRSRPIYKIALGQRGSEEDRIRVGLDGGLIHIGWGGNIDWSSERFDDFEEIRKVWNQKKDPDASGKDPNIEMMYAFRSGLQIGDYVVISDGRDSYRAFGRVSGEYHFAKDAPFHPHRRRVEWIWRDDKGVDRAAFYSKNFRRQSAYRLDPDRIDWDALEAVVIGPDAQRPVAEARPHVLIIDEINRANISKVFGELITLLEVDKRLGCENEVRVRLPYSGTSFGVPANLHIIGTMNTADRSIALLDTALRRRFTFRELMPDVEELGRALAARGLDSESLDGINLRKMLLTINERIEYLFDREHQIGHAYFTGCRSRADVEHVMRHKIIPLLAEYFYEDWSKVAAVVGDGNGTSGAHFLEARRLAAPISIAGDESGDDKLRWKVKDTFDFSDFAA